MQQRARTIRLVQLAMGASLVLPSLIFAIAAWRNYESAHALADERLIRSLDVQQEQAIKAFQLVELTMNNANDLTATLSEAEIGSGEERLHLQFKNIVSSVPVVQSVWIYGDDGRALVTSWVHPPPPQSFADRDFFVAHLNGDSGTYYGQVYASVLDAQPFFTVSRRLTRDGRFIGVLEASVLPSNFFRFFSTLAYTEGLQYALIRDDGKFLVRFPAAPPDATDQLDPSTGFRRTIAALPEGGLYTTTSPMDHL